MRIDDEKIRELISSGRSYKEALSALDIEFGTGASKESIEHSAFKVYTRATKPAATGSGLVIFVSDDGVGSLYKDTAAGVWTPLNPGELAYAQNITGTATNIASGGSADVPGCIITVPPCDRPVYLSAWCDVELYVGAAPALAQASIQINEISNGVDTPLALSAPYEVSNSPQWTQQALYCAPWRVGPVARNRQFKLTVASYAVAFRVLNNTAAPSYVTAEVR